jgi:hypothetical protein
MKSSARILVLSGFCAQSFCGERAFGGVTLSVSLTVVSNTYAGFLTLNITGLTNPPAQDDLATNAMRFYRAVQSP